LHSSTFHPLAEEHEICIFLLCPSFSEDPQLNIFLAFNLRLLTAHFPSSFLAAGFTDDDDWGWVDV
jgi:hypothetical protein